MNLYFLLLIIVILCCLNYKKADNYKLGSAASLPAPFMRPSGRIYWGERTLPKTFKEGAHWGWVQRAVRKHNPELIMVHDRPIDIIVFVEIEDLVKQ